MIFETGIDGDTVTLELDTSIEHGILLSGGLDSAVLLGLMVKVFLNNGDEVKIQPFTIRDSGSYEHSKNVIDYINDRYQISIPDTIQIDLGDVHHAKRTPLGMREIMINYGDRIEYVWQATNQNPPKEEFDYARFGNQDNFPNRVKSETFYRNKLPFIHLRKHHIVNMIDLHELGDFETITHSCTKYKKYRCMSCFQCLERRWAFDKVNKKDRGII